MTAFGGAVPVRTAEHFRTAMSGQSEGDWSAALVRAQKYTRRNTAGAASLGRDNAGRSAWSEETAWGWLTWAPVEASGSDFELVAVGVTDPAWASNKRRRRAVVANAENGGRLIYKRWLPTLSWPGVVRGGVAALIVVIVCAGIFHVEAAWPLSVAILVAIAGYYLPSIMALGSARHVRVFTGEALRPTNDALYDLLEPISSIARTATGPAATNGDREPIAQAMSAALTAAWQGTDPGVTRTDFDAIVGRLRSIAASIVDVNQSAMDVASASQLSDDGSYFPAAPAGSVDTNRLLTRLDQTNLALTDRAAGQHGAAETLRRINQPPRDTDS